MIIYQYGISYINKKYKKIVITISIIISILRFFFDKNVYTLNFWTYFILMTIIFQLLFRSFLKIMILKGSIKFKASNKLKLNDVIAYNIKKQNKIIYTDKKMINEEDDQNLFLRSGEIINEEGLNKIKKEKTDFLFPIYKRIAFAHLIFMGVVLTLLLKGNILILLTKLF